MNLRTLAAQVIFRVVFQGRSLTQALSEVIARINDVRDQAFVQAICYGVCRRYFYLEALLQNLLAKPLKEKDYDIYALLLVGLYQLTDMRIPDYAAVTETVAVVRDFKKIWAKPLINAVLRNYQRRATELQTKLNRNPQALYAHPRWIIEKLQHAYPEHWEAILAANNAHPPFSLRVNQTKLSRDQYLKKLRAEDIGVQLIETTSAGITLEKAIDVKQLPGFLEGEISVQDGAAQLAAEVLLDLQKGQDVLDACAAPGGKTAHIAEHQLNFSSLIAIDSDESRLLSVKENLQRLQLKATCIHSDVAKTENWWDGKQFDRILIDAPCSASGVIRRHPDIKILRKPQDIASLKKEQLRILTALWPLLKTNGMLIYATCSIFPEENSQLLLQFLADCPDAKEEKILASWGIDCSVGKQILPGEQGMDGFYYARLRKLY